MAATDTPTHPQSDIEVLEGTIERLTFQSADTGYTVARLIATGKATPVTVVGPLTGANPGESVRLEGRWTSHPQYGPQFEVRAYSVRLPATIEGLRKYLGSGLIKGVGPVTANRLVKAFGLGAMHVIENEPERLREVPGVGRHRAEMIVSAWAEQRQIKDLMLFLQSHGVSTGLAVRIYRHYRDQSAAVVRTQPYRLARDVFGIGFRTADQIARNLGMAPDDPARVQAGLLHTLSTLSDEGHCFSIRERLIEQAAGLLQLEPGRCLAPLEDLVATGAVLVEDDAVYLPPFYHAETGVAAGVRRLQTAPLDYLGTFATVDWDRTFVELDRLSSVQLTRQQKCAIRMALTEKVSVLTGGPGTGKSTILEGVLRLAHAQRCTVLLAAPTGRAAKRLTEAAGMEAKTIHRLLEVQPTAGFRFQRGRENPLDADLVIVDEVSMVDLLLMHHLLAAIPSGAHLLLVGDVDQLPSVGAGNVLRDLIDSDAVPTTRLDTIFRQSHDSHIVDNAHRINRGELPVFDKQSRDFYLFRQPDPERAADLIVDLVTSRIPRRYGFDPMEDIQVLAPMHRGEVGVAALNQRLQTAQNPARPGCPERAHGNRVFRLGDRVMQTRNDYERQVFNGDQGRITAVNLGDGLVTVTYDGRDVAYDYGQLEELVHAYAVSIHKAQGSEYPAVVIPVLTQHYVMLQRNLLYTAVTRARQLVVLVGDHRAIAIAVHNNRVVGRNSRLAERLRAAIAAEPPTLLRPPFA